MPNSTGERPIPSDNDHNRNVPRAEQGAFGFTPSQASTSQYASSMAETRNDDAQSQVTSYTYISQYGEAQQFLRRVDNRSFNALHDGYAFPADEDEFARLNKQHIAIVIGLSGLYPIPETVNAALAPEEGITRRILDLGTGSGVWANEMAKRFSHAQVVGLDLAPVPVDLGDIPQNVRYEIDDINEGLSHLYGQFDVVHSRLVGIGLKNYPQAMSEAISCLKPGGVLIWLEGDFDFYGGPEPKCLSVGSDDNPSGSFFQRVTYEVCRAGTRAGAINPDAMAKALDEGLWNHPMIDPETCKTGHLFLPVGSWLSGKDVNQTQLLKYVGALIRQDLMSAHRALHAKLKAVGWPEAELNEWSERADKEMMENKHSMWMRVRLVWGRRRAAPGQPAPALPTPPTSRRSSEDGIPVTPYPHLYIYDTMEESLQAAELRKRDTSIPPPPGPPSTI